MVFYQHKHMYSLYDQTYILKLIMCFYWIEFLMYHNFIITTINRINLGSSEFHRKKSAFSTLL